MREMKWELIMDEKVARFALDIGLGNDMLMMRQRKKPARIGFVMLGLAGLLLVSGLLAIYQYGVPDTITKVLASGETATAAKPAQVRTMMPPAPPAAKQRQEIKADSGAAEKQDPGTSSDLVPAADTGDKPVRAPAVETPGVSAAGTPAAPGAADAAAAAGELSRIDKLINEKDFDQARNKLRVFTQEAKYPDRMVAEAYYRLGIIARMQKNEEDALGNWDRALRTFPETPGGRLAALAIADTRFVQACGMHPDYTQWEEIAQLYSTALGRDGAPFITQKAARERMLRNLKKLSDGLFFGRVPLKGAVKYQVRPGDMLYTIARKYKVHFGAIASVNRLRAPRYTIRKGQTLKILPEKNFPCEIVVDKKRLTLTWYLGGKWVRQYPCCVGPGNKTPAGTYTISHKDANPAWRNPADGKLYEFGDPKNVLGTRWLALEGNGTTGLGIHGTTKPQSIPGRTSNGCVRLLNKDVEELYGFALIGSKVVIRE